MRCVNMKSKKQINAALKLFLNAAKHIELK
jgi:hypothetical protein